MWRDYSRTTQTCLVFQRSPQNCARSRTALIFCGTKKGGSDEQTDSSGCDSRNYQFVHHFPLSLFRRRLEQFSNERNFEGNVGKLNTSVLFGYNRATFMGITIGTQLGSHEVTGLLG